MKLGRSNRISFSMNQGNLFTPFIKRRNIRCQNPHGFFSDSDGNIYDQQFNKISTIPQFDSMPTSNNSNSYNELSINLTKWENQFKHFYRQTSPPVPLSYLFSRPNMICDQGASHQAKTYQNFLIVAEAIQDPKPIDLSVQLPKKYYSTVFTLETFLTDKLPWSSILIPVRPNPTLFSTFQEYETAMMKWGKIVYDADQKDSLPFSPTEIGEKIGLKPNQTRQIMKPSSPPEEIEPVRPITNTKLPDSKIFFEQLTDQLHKLEISYDNYLTTPPVLYENGEPPEFDSLVPLNTINNIHINQIASNLCETGVPVRSLDDTFTNILRNERSFLEKGILTNEEYTKESSINIKEMHQTITSPDTDKVFLLSLDMSLSHFQELIDLPISGTSPTVTVGQRIFESLSLQDILTNRLFQSKCSRSISKFTLLFHHLLSQCPQRIFDCLLDLNLSLLERFVETVIYCNPCTVSLETLPEEELNEVINDDPKHKDEVEAYSFQIRQAQIINALCTFIFMNSDKFLSFLPFMRRLLHRSYDKIAHMVKESKLQRIFEGYNNLIQESHQFSYRLLRSIILIQYSKVINNFSGLGILQFINSGFRSSNLIIRRNTASLCQLMLHSDTAIALQRQIIEAKPSLVVEMIKSNQPNLSLFFKHIFLMFRNTSTMFEFMPLPFEQYRGYIDAFLTDYKGLNMSIFLCTLMSICAQDVAIYTPNRDFLISFMNKFASEYMLRMVKTLDLPTLKLFSVVYKIRILNHSSVFIPTIWNSIFDIMAAKKDVSLDMKWMAWKTFKNATFNQPNIIHFFRADENLSLKLKEAFNVNDDKTIICLILSLPALSAPLGIHAQYVREVTKKNLTDLFNYLTEISVPISYRILTAYNWSVNDPEKREVRAALNTFICNIYESKLESPLNRFMLALMADDGYLSKIFVNVALDNGLKTSSRM